MKTQSKWLKGWHFTPECLEDLNIVGGTLLEHRFSVKVAGGATHNVTLRVHPDLRREVVQLLQKEGIRPPKAPKEPRHKPKGKLLLLLKVCLTRSVFMNVLFQMSQSTNQWGGPGGFSLLIWEDPLRCPEDPLICPESQELVGEEENVPGSGDPATTLPQHLADASCLIACRWNLNVEQYYVGGRWYLWVVCTRFTIGNETIRRALGDLTEYVSFQRGGPNQDHNTAIRYKECREKWGVPQQIVDREDTAGPLDKSLKRPRF